MDDFEFVEKADTAIFEKWDWKKGCYICMCRFCGNMYICSDIIRCPVCESGNIRVVPFRDDSRFCYRWLDANGFKYCEERMCIVE